MTVPRDPYEVHLPPPTEAVALPPEELALFVLRFLRDPSTPGFRNRYNFTLMSSTSYGGGLAGPQRRELQLALAEAWAWLEREGLIVPRPGDMSEWYELSRRGRSLESAADFEAYRLGDRVRKQSLNPLLEQKVWPLFVRGDYEVAVVQAFKLVEVRVRRLGRYTLDDYGVALVHKAFSPGRGRRTPFFIFFGR